jgi:hypothetical protein
VLKRILLALIALISAALIAWWLFAFKPWYNRSLTWRIIASGDRSVSSAASGWPAYNPEFTDLLKDRFPLGTPAEPAVKELEANGFECEATGSRNGTTSTASAPSGICCRFRSLEYDRNHLRG